MSQGNQGSFDPSKRRLCPDGACVGVIGDDGRCRECGRAGDGSAMASAAGVEDADALDAPGFSGAHHDDELAGAGDEHALTNGGGAGAFRPDRPLCDDGSCVGVIGADGRCSVCRRAQAGGG
jgi:hypothetical protein